MGSLWIRAVNRLSLIEIDEYLSDIGKENSRLFWNDNYVTMNRCMFSSFNCVLESLSMAQLQRKQSPSQYFRFVGTLLIVYSKEREFDESLQFLWLIKRGEHLRPSRQAMDTNPCKTHTYSRLLKEFTKLFMPTDAIILSFNFTQMSQVVRWKRE